MTSESFCCERGTERLMGITCEMGTSELVESDVVWMIGVVVVCKGVEGMGV